MVRLLKVFLGVSFPLLAAAFFLPGCATAADVTDFFKKYVFWSNYFQENSLPAPQFKLFSPGGPIFIDYSTYGVFSHAGETDFQYMLRDSNGLKSALGEGIFPNNDFYQDPAYIKMRNAGLLNGSYWDILSTTTEWQKAFFLWTQAQEEPGVKQFFTAVALENAGLIRQAVKAYYAGMVFFPRSAGWAEDHSFVWYTAPASIAAIKRLCNDYASLQCDLEGSSFKISNGEDTDLSNDIVTFNPGKIVRRTTRERLFSIMSNSPGKAVEVRGSGKVRLVKFASGQWRLYVNHRPYYIKGITYSPTPVGLGPHSDPNFGERWMFVDKNRNRKPDAPYESWIAKPSVPAGDFKLLRDMGVNTIRFYAPNNPSTAYDPSLINKPLLRDLYKKYGISIAVMDFLGAYTVGSGASLEKGTDYTDPLQRQRMKDVVRAKVMDLRNEPFVLMWILGNENNMAGDYTGVNATRTNASSQPKAYAQFLDEVAAMIHELDHDHPVAVGNLQLGLVEYYRQYAKNIDILGVNAYDGTGGFGGLFQEARAKFDRPVMITEYGCDAYRDNVGPDEDMQLSYLRGNYRSLVYNMPGGPGEGNAIGGFIFEFNDEWWKDPNDPEGSHSIKHQGKMEFPDGYSHEEWLGIVGIGNGSSITPQRQPRKAYYYFKRNYNLTPEGY